MPVAAMLASVVHQALDLALGEIAALDCQVYDAWRAFPVIMIIISANDSIEGTTEDDDEH